MRPVNIPSGRSCAVPTVPAVARPRPAAPSVPLASEAQLDRLLDERVAAIVLAAVTEPSTTRDVEQRVPLEYRWRTRELLQTLQAAGRVDRAAGLWCPPARRRSSR